MIPCRYRRVSAVLEKVRLQKTDQVFRGGFMLIRSPNGTFEFIDFRETAPNASHKDMFIHDPMAAQRGGMAVAVP